LTTHIFTIDKQRKKSGWKFKSNLYLSSCINITLIKNIITKLRELMLVLNCTKAAADLFTTTKKGKKSTPIQPQPNFSILDTEYEGQPLSQWLIHTKKINRKNIVVIMHVPTRFSMVFCDLKKGEWSKVFQLMLERLANAMLGVDDMIDKEDEEHFQFTLDNFIDIHRQFEFFQRSDRSVLGHIADVFCLFESELQDIGHLPNHQEEGAGFDEFANQTIRSTGLRPKGFFPEAEMYVEWLTRYGGVDESQADHIRNLVVKSIQPVRSKYYF
jgi:hypothetical protein